MPRGNVGEAPRTRGEARIDGLHLWYNEVQTGGGANPVTVQTPFRTVKTAVACINAAAPLGAAGAVVVAKVNPSDASQVLLERYQADNSATPAWVDSTTDLLVNVIVVGVM